MTCFFKGTDPTIRVGAIFTSWIRQPLRERGRMIWSSSGLPTDPPEFTLAQALWGLALVVRVKMSLSVDAEALLMSWLGAGTRGDWKCSPAPPPAPRHYGVTLRSGDLTQAFPVSHCDGHHLVDLTAGPGPLASSRGE